MKWEYRIRIIESDEQMNEYGQEEWEFVAVVDKTAFYKRPVGGIDEQRRRAEKQQTAERNLRISEKLRIVLDKVDGCSSR